MTGDGRSDLVILDASGVSVIGNDGSGRLESVSTVATEPPFACVLDDVDGDGDLDAMVLVETGPGLVAWLNEGDGTLSAGPSSSLPIGTTGGVAADVNGDGAPDLVTFRTSVLDVMVHLNDGSGVFASPVPVFASPLFQGVVSMQAGDIDSDGDMDLALIFGAGGIALLENDGAGGFTSRTNVLVPDATAKSAFVDLDGDGLLDLVGVDGVPAVSFVRRNLGGWVFDEVQFGTLPATPVDGFAVVRVDSDDIPDAVVVGDTRVTVVTGTLGAGPAFRSDATVLDTTVLIDRAEIVDLDQDGFDDVLATSESLAGFLAFVNQGDGTFGSPGQVAFPGKPEPLFFDTGDVNNDGVPDVVFRAGSARLRTMLGNGDGTFQAAFNASSGLLEVTQIRLVDLDGDAHLDALIADAKRGDIVFARGQGDGTFGTDRRRPFGLVDGFGMADLDGDTIDDVFVNGRTRFHCLAGVGDGTFDAPKVVFDGVDPGPVVLRDVDGDGDTDILDGNGGLLLNLGDAMFVLADPFGVFGGPPFDMADVDGDGADEIVRVETVVGILTQTGPLEFVEASRHGLPIIASDVRVGDFDGDARPDVLVTGEAKLAVVLARACESACPADLDQSGVLNFDDIDLFVNAFLSGDPRADLTSDGFLNIADVDAFVASFLAGCQGTG